MSKHWVEALDGSVYLEAHGTIASGRAGVVVAVTGPGVDGPIRVPLDPEGARKVAALLTDMAQQVEDFNKMQEEWT